MAKKNLPKVHPGTAIEALKAFHEDVAFAVASMASVASVLEQTPGESHAELAKYLRDAETRISRHWDFD
jgi:hypothetical protein